MSIATKCSHCGASYNLNDQMAGKTVRCKHCQETFVVAAPAAQPPRKAPASSEQVQPARTAPRPAPAPAGPARKNGAGKDKASPKAKKSSSGKVLLIVGSVVGVCLLLCCGLPAGLFMYGAYRTRNAAKDIQAQWEAEVDKAMKEQQARGNGGQPGPGGVKIEFPPGFGIGKQPANLDEALAALAGADQGSQAGALNWLARQPVDKGHQADVARALESVLNGGNAGNRAGAVAALKTWGDKDSVPALAKVLNDSNPGPLSASQQDAMDALARLPDPRGADAVARYLPNFFAGDNAARSLQTMGQAAAEAAVLKYYHHPDGGGRDRVRRLLQVFGTQDSAVVRESAADLKAPQTETRRLAAEWLAGVRRPDAALRAEVARALEAALTDRDNGTAERSAQALAVWGDKDSVPALAAVLDDQTAPGNVRQQAITALGKIPDEKAAAALVRCLNNGNERRNAALALQNLGAAAEKELVKYVNDPTANQDGRNEAARILQMVGSKENVNVTVALANLKDTNPGRRRDGAHALSEMPKADPAKQPEVAAALEAALNDPDRAVQTLAAKALTVWATPANVGGLLKAVESPYRPLRQNAMLALGKLQDERGAAPLAARLPVFEDRREASDALKALGPKAEKEVAKYLGHMDKDVRLEACRILRAIGTNNKPILRTLATLRDQSIVLNQRDVAEAAARAIQDMRKR
jgi:predicted Zn finger-like uncharacterized protein